MKSISKYEFYAILATVIKEALADAPHLDEHAREKRATTLAVRTTQRLYGVANV
jgi:hypothetical protein